MTTTPAIADTACPECAQGKHNNCVGVALDQASDEFATCPCWDGEHVFADVPGERDHA